MSKKLILFVFLLIISFSKVFCAGKISGKINDAVTGEPLIGANIVILGTNIGTASDLEGKYFLSNVPAGSYTIKVSYLEKYHILGMIHSN